MQKGKRILVLALFVYLSLPRAGAQSDDDNGGSDDDVPPECETEATEAARQRCKRESLRNARKPWLILAGVVIGIVVTLSLTYWIGHVLYNTCCKVDHRTVYEANPNHSTDAGRKAHLMEQGVPVAVPIVSGDSSEPPAYEDVIKNTMSNGEEYYSYTEE